MSFDLPLIQLEGKGGTREQNGRGGKKKERKRLGNWSESRDTAVAFSIVIKPFRGGSIDILVPSETRVQTERFHRSWRLRSSFVCGARAPDEIFNEFPPKNQHRRREAFVRFRGGKICKKARSPMQRSYYDRATFQQGPRTNVFNISATFAVPRTVPRTHVSRIAWECAACSILLSRGYANGGKKNKIK